MRLSRTITIAELVETLKTSSSKWLKTQAPALEAFAWQRGYGCFSVGPTDLQALCEYVDKQEEHHQRRTFQEELRMFLENTAWNTTMRMCGTDRAHYRTCEAADESGFQPSVCLRRGSWGDAPGWYGLRRWRFDARGFAAQDSALSRSSQRDQTHNFATHTLTVCMTHKTRDASGFFHS